MKTSFGIGQLQLAFKDLPSIVKHYLPNADQDGFFSANMGGPIIRVMTQEEADKVLAERMPDIFRDHPASADHVEFVVFNNNAGGPTHIIPKDFVTAAQALAILDYIGD
jgi:hypothetical protein